LPLRPAADAYLLDTTDLDIEARFRRPWITSAQIAT
jgi:cytidylate kinase